jgi:hypothetical protein
MFLIDCSERVNAFSGGEGGGTSKSNITEIASCSFNVHKSKVSLISLKVSSS